MTRGLLLILAISGLAAAENAPCNGDPALCGRRFDQVVYATAHNANSSHEQGYVFANQGPRMRRQLDDGIRGLMLDLHKDDGRPVFCHGPCALGSQDLVEGLVEIRRFLDENPNEVLCFLMEISRLTPQEIEKAFDEACISRYCLPHEVGKPWPTLGEMIALDKRIVVLTDDDTGGVPWLLPMWTVMWDNDWSNQTPADFDCECNRGKVSNPLFNLNQFLTNPLPFPGSAVIANDADALFARGKACWEQTGRVPNFITVDHYEIGGLFDAVKRLNALVASGLSSQP